MNNTTHTPGPWMTEHETFEAGSAYWIHSQYENRIARVSGGTKHPSAVTNAHLIAAAPAMYAALKACLESLRVAMRFDDGDVFGVDHNDTVDAMGLAETTLAQAEGRDK